SSSLPTVSCDRRAIFWPIRDVPACQSELLHIKICLYLFGERDGSRSQPRARRNGRYIEGGGRIQPPAYPASALGRGPDSLGPDRYPRPIAAARLAPPEAPPRRRPDRALPGGLVGLFPACRQ